MGCQYSSVRERRHCELISSFGAAAATMKAALADGKNESFMAKVGSEVW
jgi:hypothetical protein